MVPLLNILLVNVGCVDKQVRYALSSMVVEEAVEILENGKRKTIDGDSMVRAFGIAPGVG